MQETQETQVQSLSQEIPGKRLWQPTLVFFPGECQDQKSLRATVHAVTKSRTRLKWLSVHVHIYTHTHTHTHTHIYTPSFSVSFQFHTDKAMACKLSQNCEQSSFTMLYSRLLYCVLSHFTCVWLFATLCTVAHQAPLSMGLSREEHWSGLPCPPPGDLPDPGIEPVSLAFPALESRFFHTNTSREAHSKSLLVIYFIYISEYMLIPISEFVTLCPIPPQYPL